MPVIVRDWLIEQITPLLPKRSRVVKGSPPDSLSVTTVMVKQQAITKGATPVDRSAEFLITIAVPSSKESELDDAIIDLLNALDEVKNLIWTTANKVVFKDQYPAYDITARIPYTKDTKE